MKVTKPFTSLALAALLGGGATALYAQRHPIPQPQRPPDSFQQAPAQSGRQALQTAEQPAAGITDRTRQNWKRHCASCHGLEGQANTKIAKRLNVRDLTDPEVQKRLEDDAMFTAIKHGIFENGKKRMDAYEKKLSDEEIRELVALVRTFGR